MAYDETSFLQGIAVGKSLKGWSGGSSSTIPTCWHDKGEYDHYYIDYHYPITKMSIEVFRLCTRLIYGGANAAGMIMIEELEGYNSTTFKIWADISPAKNSWAATLGISELWLEYDSGRKVPIFAAPWWIDGQTPWSFGMIQDEGTIPERDGITGEAPIEYTYLGNARYVVSDSGKIIRPALSSAASAKVTYH